MDRNDIQRAGSAWQVADVKRPLMSVFKMFAAVNRLHLGSKDPRRVRPKGDVIPLRKCHRSLGQERRDPQEAGLTPAGLGPEVCVTDEGQTERVARGKVVQFGLGVWGMGKRNANSDPHAEEQLAVPRNMNCESWRRGRRTHTLESRVVSHTPFPGLVQALCGWEES